jgi:hypothetical protein
MILGGFGADTDQPVTQIKIVNPKRRDFCPP